MSGVITAQGQFEHCQGCRGRSSTGDYSPRGRWVLIQDLCYQEPNTLHEHGRDLCADCYEEREKCAFCANTALVRGTTKYDRGWIIQVCAQHASLVERV